VVVVDPFPLFRAGTVAALGTADGPATGVLGVAETIAEGTALARSRSAAALVVGDPSVAEVQQAVAALPTCAVVVLVSDLSRRTLVDMLGAGVAGIAPRTIEAPELLATVEKAIAAHAAAGSSEDMGASGAAPFPFSPVALAPAGSIIPAEGNGHGGRPDGPVPSSAGALSPKEKEVLGHLARGASTKAIADAMYVTQATVKTHLAHIYAKLGVRGRHEAIARAFAVGELH
jgi:two-component system nitrate/nitrite response regulator NarL